MKQTFKKINNDDLSQCYETLFDSKKEILNMLHQPHLEGRDNSSEDSDGSWAGSKSYQEAEDLYKYGDENSFSKLKKLKVKTDNLFNDGWHSYRTILKSVEGFAPDVVAAMRGLPKAMHNQKLAAKNVTYKKVFFQRGFICDVSTDDIELNGLIPLSLIDFLESTGKYRFEIWTGVASTPSFRDNNSVIFATKVKDYDSPLNLYQLSFDLINPAYLRRIYFKICETNSFWPDITDGYGSSHGSNIVTLSKDLLGNDTIVVGDNLNVNTDNSDDENTKEVEKAFGIIKPDPKDKEDEDDSDDEDF